jgi:4-hydroxy-tetrahydrodipicolinate synthase
MLKLEGCMTAMVTPFDSKMEVDYEGLRANVRFQIDNGVKALVPLGTTGESPTIREEERKKIIEAVVAEARGRVPVIVGTGTNSTHSTMEHTREAEDLGADAALVVSPYYNKPTQEGLYRHFEAVSKSARIPIIIYNIQGRTGVNIETPTLMRLAKLHNIAAVKEASGSVAQMMDVIDQKPKEFAVLSGDDNLTLPLIGMGGRGVISVVSNLLPKRVSGMVDAALSGDMERARKMHYELMPIFKGAFVETNPIPIKAAMKLSGMPSGGLRLPLCEMQQQNLDKLRQVLLKYKELKIV